jgi:hypothetical protein
MALVELIHSQGSHRVSVVPLITKCDLFKNNPGLTISPSLVQSAVSLDEFREFSSALKDQPIDIKDRNLAVLSQLTEEFGFEALLAKLSIHQRLLGLTDAQAAEVRSRLSALKERAGQHERQIEELQSLRSSVLRRVDVGLARAASELETFRDTKNSDTAPPAAAAQPARAPAKPPPTAAPAVAAPPGRMESLIVDEYLPLFQEFRAKRFNLLWRGSRDGFGGREFHRRCDGRANTLTLILTDEGWHRRGSIFGDFTPVKWDSGGNVC